MKTTNSERGQVNAGAAVALVISLTIAGLLGAFLVPVAVDSFEGDTTTTLNISTGSTEEVNGELEATVDSTTAGTSATITLNQTDGNSVTNTVNVGSTTTYSMDRGDVNVTVSEATSGYAVADYSYANDFAFSSGASSLWGLMGLTLVLALFLAVLSMATDKI
jgi:Flp pilus assembly protein TadG